MNIPTPIKMRSKWRVRITNEHGKRASAVFAKHKDAELFAASEFARIEEVKRGLRSLIIPNKTFDEVFDYRLAHTQKRSIKDDISNIRAHLRPFFGAMLVRDFQIMWVDQFKKTKSHLSPKTLFNQLTLLITCLNLAQELGWISRVPKIRKPKISVLDTDYSYLETQDQIDQFLRTAKAFGQMTHILYLAAINTGMRQGELAALTWSDVDFERGQLRVSKSFSGPTKNGESRIVPILEPLSLPLKEWRLRNPLEHVFVSQKGTMLQRKARIFQETFQKIVNESGIFKNVPQKKKRLVFHSLRHSFASHMMMKGADIFMLQRILGHKDIKMTQRYSHLAPHAFDEVKKLFQNHSSVHSKQGGVMT